jgi:hypothetical protein
MKPLDAPRTVAQVVSDWIWSFHPRTVPSMQRGNYTRELVSWAFLPMMLGAVEGGTMSILVKKAWTDVEGVSPVALDFAVAFVAAAPNFANLTSFVWGSLSRGRDKVRFISRIQLATCVFVAAVAAMPLSLWGLVGTCLLVLAARVTWTGVITARAAVWRQNYPKANRASIAGRMATVQSVVLAAAGWLVGAAMDFSAQSFHVVFPVLALIGVYGNSIFRKVRVRGGRRLVRAERAQGAVRRVSANPVATAAMTRDALAQNLDVLRDDPEYRRFMTWMFIFGLGNLMIGAPQAIVLEDTLKVSYLRGILATTVIPLVVMPLAIPMWARLLDRMHIVEFRRIHGWSFVAAAGLLFVATLGEQLWMFYVAAVALGIGFGGGTLAWNLGHQDFATPETDALYMSVHVTLNGLRGVIAPFLAVALYSWLASLDLSAWVFFACFVVNVIGVVGFEMHWRALRRRAATATARGAADAGPALAPASVPGTAPDEAGMPAATSHAATRRG